MIARITGKLLKKQENAVVVELQGVYYEIIVPTSVLDRLDEQINNDGDVNLVTYYYIQSDPSRSVPVLVGFINEIEKDFFHFEVPFGKYKHCPIIH